MDSMVKIGPDTVTGHTEGGHFPYGTEQSSFTLQTQVAAELASPQRSMKKRCIRKTQVWVRASSFKVCKFY